MGDRAAMRHAIAVTFPTASAFVGRGPDRDRISVVLDQLRGGLSAALIVSGDAGIGKTELLRRTLNEATELRAFAISGYESEVQLAFAALHRLLLPLLDHVALLPKPQHDALAVAFGLEPGPPPTRFLVGVATMTLLARAAEKGPLLCVVDDAQWVDPETLNTLAFVARRLDTEGVGLLLGLRSSGPPLAAMNGIPEHRLAPMNDRDMRVLLSGVAEHPVPAHVAARLIAESDGNPLALLEYATSLSPERLAGTTGLPPALPISDRLSAGFAGQISQLPPTTRDLLLLLASTGPDDTDVVLGACRLLSLDPDIATPAIRAAILDASPSLAFRHPLIRSAVYDTADPAAVRRAHSALAASADDLGYSDAAAWHRAYAASGPDEDVAAQLEKAATRARERGGYAAMATFLTLAADHSVPDTDEHARRLLAAAQAHITAGNGAQATTLLDGWNPVGWSAGLVAAARVGATIAVNDARSGLESAVLASAASKLSPDQHEMIWQLRSGAFFVALETRECTRETTLHQLARELLENPIAAIRQPAALDLLCEGLAARYVFGYEAAAPTLRRALRLVGPETATEASTALLVWMAMEDLWDDDFQSTVWPAVTAENQQNGAWAAAWIGLGSSAITEMRHGRFEAAQDLFDETSSVGAAMGVNDELLWATLIELRAWQGRADETRSMAQRLQRFWGDKRRYGSMHNYAATALTALELGAGHYAEAHVHATRVARDDPPGHGSRILSDLVEAAVRTGDDAAAKLALDKLNSRARTAGTPWALAVRARTEAVALRGSPSAEELYDEAVNRLSSTTLRIEIARTHLLYGEWLRRRRRRKDARTHLSIAVDAFMDMGATLFAERADRELAIVGGRDAGIRSASAAPTLPLLTPQERRVAELAAQGLTNLEISQRLFVSTSTVDYHLSKVFRKLQVTSRRRLREFLPDDK